MFGERLALGRLRSLQVLAYLAIVLATILAMLLFVVRSAYADDGGRPFTVTMTGSAERPGPGDPDGSGTAFLTLNQGQGEVCFTLTVSNLALPATGAHIHRAPVTSPGPIVVPLTPPDATGTSSGCATGVDPDLIKEIRQNPVDFYVNVHTTEYPAGAVRAQLQ